MRGLAHPLAPRTPHPARAAHPPPTTFSHAHSYVEGGERAVTRFEEGVQGYETRAFRGLGIFSSSPYEVSDGKQCTTRIP